MVRTRTIAINDASQVMFNEEYRAVTINPAADLIPNTKYNVTIANGVVRDAAGNLFSGISDQTTLNYTTIASDPLLSRPCKIHLTVAVALYTSKLRQYMVVLRGSG